MVNPDTSELLERSQDVNARQLFTIFVSAVAAVAFFLLTLQQIGTPAQFLVYMSFAFLAMTYPIVAFISRTMSMSDYLIASRRNIPRFAGMAIAAGAVSGTLLMNAPGEVFTLGYQGALLVVSVFIGLFVGAVLFSAPIHQARAATLGEFFAGRANARFPRLIAMLVVVAASFPLLLGQLALVREISRAFFDISGDVVLVVGLVAVSTCLLAGGMRGLSWIRTGLYVVIAAGFVIPIAIIASKLSGFAIPHFAYGFGALEPLGEMSLRFSANETFFAEGMQPDIIGTSQSVQTQSLIADIVLVAIFGFGIAATPHLLQHYATLKTRPMARSTGTWAIALAFIVVGAAPAYAAFMKFTLLNTLPGVSLSDLTSTAPWVFDYGLFFGEPLVAICGQSVASLEEVVSACGAGEDYLLREQDIFVSPMMIMLGAGVIADQPVLISILLGIGVLAAVFATVDGLLMATAATLAHDGLHMSVKTRRPAVSMRIFSTRFVLLMVTLLAGSLSIQVPMSPGDLAGFSFALAGGVLFPALVLRAYYPRTTSLAAALGMAFGLTAFCALWVQSVMGFDLIIDSGDETGALIGLFVARYQVFEIAIAAFAVTALVTVLLSFLRSSKPKPGSDVVEADNQPERRPDVAEKKERHNPQEALQS